MYSHHVEVYESSSDDDDWELPVKYSEESNGTYEDCSETSDEDKIRDQRHGNYQGRSVAHKETFEEQNVSAGEIDNKVDFDDATLYAVILIFPLLLVIPMTKTLRSWINLLGF